MRNTAFRSVAGVAKDFLSDNKKSVISFAAVFFAALALGIFLTVGAAGGEFEEVSRADTEFGAVKVFFTACFALICGYAVFLIPAKAPSLSPVALLPFGLLGYFSGRHCCLLIACYGMTGLTNLLLVYLPFFLVSLAAAAVAGARVTAMRGCERLKCAAVLLGKVCLFNFAAAFLFFIVIGSMTKVVVVVF